MTRKGGEHDYGVVFSVDRSGSNYTVLHDFAGGHDDGATSDHGYVVQSGHHLYGMTTNGGHHDDGVIFKLNIDDQSFQLLHRFGETHHDGKNPYGSLLLVDNKLYGTTANGATMTWARFSRSIPMAAATNVFIASPGRKITTTMALNRSTT
jgi:uncharacterized repeat protein (TIGR03803 family)